MPAGRGATRCLAPLLRQPQHSHSHIPSIIGTGTNAPRIKVQLGRGRGSKLVGLSTSASVETATLPALPFRHQIRRLEAPLRRSQEPALAVCVCMAMSSGFVSGGKAGEEVERDDEWKRAQQEVEEARRAKAELARQQDGKSLYE